MSKFIRILEHNETLTNATVKVPLLVLVCLYAAYSRYYFDADFITSVMSWPTGQTRIQRPQPTQPGSSHLS